MNLQGLSAGAVEESRRKYGSNALTRIPPTPLWKRILEGFKDPMISILCVALVIQVVLFVLGRNCLNVTTWLICLAVAFLVIPADMLRKAVVRRRQ